MAVFPRDPPDNLSASFKNPSKTTTIVTIVVSISFLLLYILGLAFMLYYYFAEDSSPSLLSLGHLRKKSEAKTPSGPSGSANSTPSPPPQRPPRGDLDITEIPQESEHRGQYMHKHHAAEYQIEAEKRIGVAESSPVEKKASKKHGRKSSDTIESTASNVSFAKQEKHAGFGLKKQASTFSFDHEGVPRITVADAI